MELKDFYKNKGIGEDERKLMNQVYKSNEEDLEDIEKIYIIRCKECQTISHYKKRKNVYKCKNEDCRKEINTRS